MASCVRPRAATPPLSALSVTNLPHLPPAEGPMSSSSAPAPGAPSCSRAPWTVWVGQGATRDALADVAHSCMPPEARSRGAARRGGHAACGEATWMLELTLRLPRPLPVPGMPSSPAAAEPGRLAVLPPPPVPAAAPKVRALASDKLSRLPSSSADAGTGRPCVACRGRGSDEWGREPPSHAASGARPLPHDSCGKRHGTSPPAPPAPPPCPAQPAAPGRACSARQLAARCPHRPRPPRRPQMLRPAAGLPAPPQSCHTRACTTKTHNWVSSTHRCLWTHATAGPLTGGAPPAGPGQRRASTRPQGGQGRGPNPAVPAQQQGGHSRSLTMQGKLQRGFAAVLLGARLAPMLSAANPSPERRQAHTWKRPRTA